jgi:dGTPase
VTASKWEQALQERRLPRNENRDGDHRNPYQRDKARVLHSAAFRRLQAKTQVLGVGLSDFYRTRLTHSLEAAQIGTGITAQLCGKFPDVAETLALDATLIETLCLAHDIGHPPFGHGGEIALHYMMHSHGGFEGNGQTFRIISKLEPHYMAIWQCQPALLRFDKLKRMNGTLRRAFSVVMNHCSIGC